MASYLNQQFCTPPQTCCVISVPNQRQSAVEYAKKHRSTFLGLAVTELILGIFCLGLGISSLPICTDGGCTYYYYPYEFYDFYYFGALTMTSTGIWGGALVIVFASFGLAQVCAPSVCKVTTNLTLSIFGFLIAATMMGIEIAAAAVSYHNVALVVIHSLIATFSFVLFILFIVSTSYAGAAKCSGCCGGSCCGGCCCEESNTQQVVVNGTPSQLITLPNGQMVLMQGAPQGNPQPVATPSVVNSPPQYTVSAPAQQQIFSAVPGSSAGVVNQSFQAPVPNKV